MLDRLPFNDGDCKLLIDAPKLEYLITGGVALYHLVKRPVGLVVAEFDFWFRYCDGWKDMMNSVVQEMSCIRSFIVLKEDLCLFDSVECPVFHQLDHLELTGNFPENGSWSEVPASWLSKVSRIDVADIEGSDYNFDLLQNIRSRANVLEQLNVYFQELEERQRDQLWIEYTFYKKVFQFAKSYPSCRIEFSGFCISASSNDFKIGLHIGSDSSTISI